MINIQNIKVLEDNLVWIISKNNECIIIDPGQATPIIKKLEKNNLTPKLIFITHLHKDHINGIYNLLKNYPKIKIFTPKKIKFIKKSKQIIIKKNSEIIIFNKLFKIFKTPGHTNIDISYYFYPYLFCGDTLFSAGCGKTYDGCPKKLYFSLKKIIKLNKNTIFFNSHEYTLSNLKFANFINPKDFLIKEYYNYVKKNFRNLKQYSNLNFEKKINIFFKIKEKNVQNIINYWYKSKNTIDYFCNLRKIKNKF
ncbi:MAG: hydroxyacylglutathione hydrolase [Buchnera aphidicola (Periphyllus acericola)]|uniref:hydroxyacylglutathione hydrolase n=1 Tax=Buchnera aphidicola TaxID=9 RepID=UPI0030D45608|nr:hydroxyacylglutathione hydrolase [Buchnera aphidicola (Periphyllus acericola)]